MDREQIFQWIARKQWTELVKFLTENRQAIEDDEIIASAVRTFLSELVRDIEEARTPEHRSVLETAYLYHFYRGLTLPDDVIATVTEALVGIQSDPAMAFDFAKRLPQNPVCAAAIQRYHESRQQQAVIEAGQRRVPGLRVVENIPTQQIDARRSLFASGQEREFFRAVVDNFPHYAVYPNVALQSILRFEDVEAVLSVEERAFFFRGTVDCVVFDTNDYLPRFFFELDSVYHDNAEQQARDAMKDRIFTVSGQKLTRIRKTGRTAGFAEFSELVREALKAA